MFVIVNSAQVLRGCLPHFAVLGAVLAILASVLGPAAQAADETAVVDLLELVIEADPDTARECLQILAGKLQSGELDEKALRELRPRLDELLTPILTAESHPLREDAAVVAASWKSPAALQVLRDSVRDEQLDVQRRRAALRGLIAGEDPQRLNLVRDLLAEQQPVALRAAVLDELGQMAQPEVAEVVLAAYPSLPESLRPRAIELLTQRNAWSTRLLEAIAQGHVPASALNTNEVRKLLATNDPQIAELVQATWGTLRQERDPQREQVIAEMRKLLSESPGDPHRGQQVFQRICGQCHVLHGQGENVGPDITANGRGSYEQLLSNVFDPSLVIGASYQARTVITADGRVLTGLPIEETDQRVVLKLQGGKTEVLPQDEIEEIRVSPLSLMPEGIEKQLTPQEIADLFALLTLDKPPGDSAAQPIAGAEALHPQRQAE